MATQPTAVTNTVIGTRTANSIPISWTNGNGAGRIVIARLNNTTRVAPTTGTVYTANSASFTDVSNSITGTGNVVVYNGTGNNVEVTGLSANTNYIFDIYDYNGTTGTINYSSVLSSTATSTLSAEPSTQASSITYSNITATGMTIGFTTGNGAGRIILVKQGNAVDAIPIDGTSYTGNLAFGSGNQIGTGNFVVRASTATGTATITNLNPNTTYHIAIFEYNGTSGTINYLTSSALIGSATTRPTPASNVAVTSRTVNSIGINWTNGNGTGRIVVARTPSAISPTDGTEYTSNSTDINDVLNSITGTDNFVVYNGTDNNVNITGLSASTNYKFDVYEYNGSGAERIYALASTSATNIFTLNTEPTTAASIIGFSNINATGLTINMEKGDGANRLIIAKANSAVDANPVDGENYNANAFGSGTQIGSGNYVVYSGTAANATITGLSANTTYHFAVYEFNGSGSTTNYLTTNTPVANQITLVAAPTAPTNLSFSTITQNSFNISFTATSGSPTGYLVMRRMGAALTGSPVGGTVYEAGQSIGAAANQIIYVGTDALSNFAQTGLVDNTTYHYAVYAYSGSGSQTNYSLALSGSQTTTSIIAPIANEELSLSSSGFISNWTAVNGANEYKIDVSEFNSFAINGYSNDLIISEYCEGTSNNKYIEIFNGTNSDIGLSNYILKQSYDGNGWDSNQSFSLPLSGVLSKNEVYVIAASNASSQITSKANLLISYSTTAIGGRVPFFTGNDAIGLFKNNMLIDLFGNPNSSALITVGGVNAGENRTNIRKSIIIDGNIDWSSSSGTNESNSEWITFGTDYFDNIGAHTMLKPLSPSFLPGYNNLSVASTSQEVTGLTPNSTYYYRVRAVGGNSTSENSNVVTVLTLPAAPVASAASVVGAQSFVANWALPANGATSYALDVATDADFNTLVSGYNNLTVTGTSQLVEGLSANTTYYYRVRAINASGNAVSGVITVATNNTITLSENANADDIDDCPTCDLVIANNVIFTLNESKTYNTVTLAPQGKLTVNSGQTLTVSGDLRLESNAAGTATLVDNGTINVTGTITAQQYLAASRNWYVASPVSNANALGAGFEYWQYNEPNGSSTTENWTVVSASTALVPGRGYVVKPSAETTYAFSTTTGTLNTGNVTVPLTRTVGVTKEGFNLVGNPYPSYLNLNDLLTGDLETSYWMRSRNAGNTAWIFDSFNKDGNVAVNNSGKTVTTYVPPMQSFWVRVKSGVANTNLVFNNTMRAHIDEPANRFRAPQNTPLIRLEMSNGTASDQTVLYAHADASDAFDRFDTHKMLNNSAAVPDIYSMLGSQKMVINGMQSLPLNIEMPLGILVKEAGSFSIRASEVRAIDADIVLIDKLNGNAEWLLNGGAEYQFASSTTTHAERFALVLRAPGTTTGECCNDILGAQTMVFVDAFKNINISCAMAVNKNAKVAVYNAVGQMLTQQNLENGVARIAVANHGVYLVELNVDGLKTTKRVIVK